jgi:hypothetical protein
MDGAFPVLQVDGALSHKHKRQLDGAVILSAEGATGCKVA